MLSTTAFQPRFHTFQCLSMFSNPDPNSRIPKTSVTQTKLEAPSLPPYAIHRPKRNSNRRNQISFTCSAAAAALESVASETPSAPQAPNLPPETQETNVMMVKPVAKVIAKPRLVVKFLWMEKSIGLGLNQEIPGHGSIPLSPYYFWPRKDAWEELKSCIESKPWISQKSMIILLNQATDIINLWQQSGGNLPS